jgi:hypothetical protein
MRKKKMKEMEMRMRIMVMKRVRGVWTKVAWENLKRITNN